jgi:type VI secretion system secreted protein VgrG
MPAFMTIGKLNEATWMVEPGEILGDATAFWHERWMSIKSFSVDMKDEKRLQEWENKQGPKPKAKVEPAKKKEKGKPGAKDKKKDVEKEEPRENTLTVGKPTDSASCKIFAWTKTAVPQDIQIDCCANDEDWPFLSVVFLNAFPTEADFDDEPSDTLKFSWKKAVVFTWLYDEANKPYASDVAEFGDDAESSGTTTTEQRGLSTYVPPPPHANEGAGHGPAARVHALALDGALPPIPEEEHTYDQERRRLAIEKIGDLEFQLESFRGEERLSTLFHYDLELRSAEVAIAPKDIVGHEVSFRIEDDESREEDTRDPRHFSGVIATFLAGEMASDKRRRYHATVLPTVWKLTQRSDSRVWQDKDVKEIVEEVFRAASFSDYDMQDVTRTHPKLSFCVQYQESDFAFVSRLLEDAGIFYFFRHEDGKHTMVLCDGPAGYVKVDDALRFAHDVYREPRVTAWRNHYSFVPGKFAATDWNFTTPQEPIKGQSSTKLDVPDLDKYEVFEYPGRYDDADQAVTIADRRLQEREAGHHFVHAVGCYDSLVPGMTICVEKLPGEDEASASKRWLVTGIRFRAEQLPEYGISIIGYSNTFTCIPESVPYTPPRTTRKPRMHGPQTAVVVGDQETDEEVVDADKYGRIKVQFHWDRAGKKDTDSSCWIRVAQSLAGGGYGSMFLPRIGWEVVVSFLDGDPDRPLVTGVVYNELHMPYHELPAAKHKTVWMTRSFPGGGKDNFNELTFHDEKDKEEIYFHAERDFKRVVEHDDVLEIGEKDTGKQTITIQGDQTLTIEKGNREHSIKEGKDTLTVKGDRTITVQSGNQKLDISAGKSETSAAQAIELKVGGNSIKIDTSGITLTVGGSSVKVDQSGVAVSGMTVKCEGSLSLELKGMMINVSADGMLQTKGGITMMQ